MSIDTDEIFRRETHLCNESEAEVLHKIEKVWEMLPFFGATSAQGRTKIFLPAVTKQSTGLEALEEPTSLIT